MQLSIKHRTSYRYAEPAQRVSQAFRLWPAPCAGQRIRDWLVEVNGRRLQATCVDGFANPAATHTTEGLLDCIRIDVSGHVDTSNRHGVLGGSVETLPPELFLYETPLTAVNDAIRALASQAADTQGDVPRLHVLCNQVRDHLDYVPEQTDSQTTAIEALANGAGVCQDHAHVLSAAARTLGFPARYVSGYLCSGDEDMPAASHAWTEIFVRDLGWVGIDAANRMSPNEHYFRIACGRDYRDAAPVRGLHHGGIEETLEVSVRIVPTPIQQQVQE